MKTTICKICNTQFNYKPSKDKKDRQFCSRDCYLEHHKKVFIVLKCDGCGKDIKRNANSKIYKTSWCSDKCKHQVAKDIVNKCIVCDVEFCAVAFRKSKYNDSYTITKTKRKVCSTKCHHEFYRVDQDRKDKISKAVQGENHPNYVNGSSYNKRIRKTEMKEIFSKQAKQELFIKFDNKCFNCRSTKKLSLDHNVPFSRGGRLTESNTVLLCLSCNSSKNAKLPKDFYSVDQLKQLEKLGIVDHNLFNYVF